MRFEDHQLTPAAYRYAFLNFVDELAPEVFESLKALLPKYKKVFGKFEYHNVMGVYECIIAHKAEDEDYLLFELDESVKYHEPDKPVTDESKIKILQNFLDFREGFYEFIDRFGLETTWLKQDLFSLLFFMAESPKHFHNLALATAYSWMPYNGKPLSFKFDGWGIEYESKDYEKKAIAAFKIYLREYIKQTAEQAKIDGYKLIRRKRDIESVKYLVMWTVKKMSKEEIIEIIDKKRSKKSGQEIYTDISTLNKAFQKFRKYGLPVRRE